MLLAEWYRDQSKAAIPKVLFQTDEGEKKPEQPVNPD